MCAVGAISPGYRTLIHTFISLSSNMIAQDYAQAFFLATHKKSDGEQERITKNLLHMLEEKGHTALLPSIVRELEKISVRNEGQDELVIKLAREADMDTHTALIETDIASLGAQELPRKVIVDETLIGGYELHAHGARIDRTYKRSLIILYNNLISN